MSRLNRLYATDNGPPCPQCEVNAAKAGLDPHDHGLYTYRCLGAVPSTCGYYHWESQCAACHGTFRFTANGSDGDPSWATPYYHDPEDEEIHILDLKADHSKRLSYINMGGDPSLMTL